MGFPELLFNPILVVAKGTNPVRDRLPRHPRLFRCILGMSSESIAGVCKACTPKVTYEPLHPGGAQQLGKRQLTLTCQRMDDVGIDVVQIPITNVLLELAWGVVEIRSRTAGYFLH